LKSTLVTLVVALLLTAAAGVVFHGNIEARGMPEGILVERVGANRLRLFVHGRWEDVPMMPLGKNLCGGGDPYFDRYCR
jgi:hypothetical protein